MINKDTITLINKGERRIKAKMEAIEDLQNELNLLKEQTFNLYKNNVVYDLTLSEDLILKTRDWLKMVKDNKDADGKELNMRKKYPQKEIFDYITNKINDYCGIEDCVINNVYDFNFGSAYNIEFSSSGHEWNLYVPVVQNIKFDYWEYYGEDVFQFHLDYKDGKYSWKRIGTTFDKNELSGLMKLGIVEAMPD